MYCEGGQINFLKQFPWLVLVGHGEGREMKNNGIFEVLDYIFRAKQNVLSSIDKSNRFIIGHFYSFFVAITIVALGTTLPDILGARMVTRAEEHADGALIHISGSIAVNVLIGVGVPWFVAALWHNAHVSNLNISSDFENHKRAWYLFVENMK